MGRKPREHRLHAPRLVGGLVVWAGAALLAQGLCSVGGGGGVLEQRLEKARDAPRIQPERSHEDDALEPWELVKV
jgi:hypothetical protein